MSNRKRKERKYAIIRVVQSGDLDVDVSNFFIPASAHTCIQYVCFVLPIRVYCRLKPV